MYIKLLGSFVKPALEWCTALEWQPALGWLVGSKTGVIQYSTNELELIDSRAAREAAVRAAEMPFRDNADLPDPESVMS